MKEIKSIKELLESLKTSDDGKQNLANTKETWARIGRKETAFPELEGTGMTIEDWMKDNDYSAIS